MQQLPHMKGVKVWKSLTPFNQDRIICMYQWGNSLTEIAKHTGKDTTLIRSFLRHKKVLHGS